MTYFNHKNKLLITSVLFLLLGIAFIVYPANSIRMLVMITGGFLILLGAAIVIPAIKDRQTLGFRFGFLVAVAIILAVFGVILLVMPDAFIKVFWITMGIILILDGIKNLLFLTTLPRKLMVIIMAVLSIVCGVLILMHPFQANDLFSILIGVFYIYSGAAGVFLSILGLIEAKKIADITAQAARESAERAKAEAAEAAAEASEVTEAEEVPEDAPQEAADEEDPYDIKR